ncbi:39S ribosomal protein L10, mitochondrial isoform X2 [Cephus cinctus]|uniref:Large ribosomal subunit protein uL10m n=1 Tax=Cephus cinctus TaxID=211228 RepID=A0AAJ7FTK3_CEPCN|nr:39S ribosomal protein L10, mitochondrial isoform X2 [Cephus cinctus]
MSLLLNKAGQPLSRQIFQQQKRFRSKINIQRPRAPHYERAKALEFMTPFFSDPKANKSPIELCGLNKKYEKMQKVEVNPYKDFLARECLNWFRSSRMVGFFHENSMTMDDKFEFAVPLKKQNIYIRFYSSPVVRAAVTNTEYEAIIPLYCSKVLTVFSPDCNVTKMHKISRKFPQLILMAGILDGHLLNRNEFLEYGKMSLTSARVGLVQTLQNAGGINLNQQLTHHQSTLVTRLGQIGTSETVIEESDK